MARGRSSSAAAEGSDKKRQRQRSQTEDEAADFETAKLKHSKTTSPHAKQFSITRLSNNPTHDKAGMRLLVLECNACALEITRRVVDSGTTTLSRHLQVCRVRDASQTHLGDDVLKAEDVDQTFALWISASGRPYSIVHDKYLNRLLHPIAKKALRKQYRRKVALAQKELYHLGQQEVKKLLKSIDGAVFIGLDGWSSENQAEVCGMVVYYRDKEGKVCELPLDFIPLVKRHTGQYLAEVLMETATFYGIKDKLAGVVSDNASNMAKAVEFLGKKGLPRFKGKEHWIRCFAHTLNLVCRAILTHFEEPKKKKPTKKKRHAGAAASASDDEDLADQVDEPGETYNETVSKSKQKRQRRDARKRGVKQPEVSLFAEDSEDEEDEDEEELNTLLKEVTSHLELVPEEYDDAYSAESAGRAFSLFAKVFKKLRYNKTARNKLLAIATEKGIQGSARVKSSVKTRWNSQLGQSKDIHRLKEALEEWQEDPDLEIPEALQLSEGDFQLAKDLTVVLQPLYDLTLEVSNAGAANMGDVIRWIDDLTVHFDDLLSLPTAHDATPATGSSLGTIPPALHNAILKGHKVLQKYYALSDDSVFYRIAILLHPSLRLKYMGDQFWEKDWQDDAIEVAEKYYAPYRSRWKEQNPSSSRSETSAQPPQGKKRGIAAFVANQVAVSAPSGDATASPLLRFCKSAPELNSTSDPIKNPLKWWLAERSQGREHEGLTAMALDIFTAPVSSVGVERTFSFGRHLLQHTRHSLSEDSVCRSLAVGSWARKDIFPDGILHKSRLLATKAKKAAKAREKGKAKEQEQNLGSIVLDTDGDAESQDDEDEEEGWTDEE